MAEGITETRKENRPDSYGSTRKTFYNHRTVRPPEHRDPSLVQTNEKTNAADQTVIIPQQPSEEVLAERRKNAVPYIADAIGKLGRELTPRERVGLLTGTATVEEIVAAAKAEDPAAGATSEFTKAV